MWNWFSKHFSNQEAMVWSEFVLRLRCTGRCPLTAFEGSYVSQTACQPSCCHYSQPGISQQQSDVSFRRMQSSHRAHVISTLTYRSYEYCSSISQRSVWIVPSGTGCHGKFHLRGIDDIMVYSYPVNVARLIADHSAGPTLRQNFSKAQAIEVRNHFWQLTAVTYVSSLTPPCPACCVAYSACCCANACSRRSFPAFKDPPYLHTYIGSGSQPTVYQGPGSRGNQGTVLSIFVRTLISDLCWFLDRAFSASVLLSTCAHRQFQFPLQKVFKILRVINCCGLQ